MLTQQQLEKIASYCKTMGVKYYDVELELVDHIAGSIEHLQNENSALDFEDALRMATRQFAPNEFLVIIKNKETQLKVRFKRLLTKEFLGYFTFPKIMLTLLLFTAMFFIDSHKFLNHLSEKQTHLPYFICLILFSILRQDGDIVNVQRWFKRIINRPSLPLLTYKVLLTRNKIIEWVPFIWYCTCKAFSTGLIENMTLKNDIFLYSFPLFFIICLAWKKVFIGQTKLMQKQYATAFEI